MNYIYASLLLHSAGKPVNEEGIKRVVEAAGEQADDAKIKALVAALEGVDIKSVIEKAAMPVTVAAPAQTVSAAETPQKKEEPSEEELEKKAETAAEGLASLFG